MHDFGELAGIDGFEGAVAAFEFFERFEGGLGHTDVGFGGTAEEHEFFAAGDTFVAVVVVEAEPEEGGGLGGARGGVFWLLRFFGRLAHRANVGASVGVSSGFSLDRSSGTISQ